jgi:NAD(P)-dependent dehydrogenase (short-subunit alcohol dehydrogenase family)
MSQDGQRVAFITGAGRGIGRTLAQGFDADGYRVAVASTTAARNDAVVKSIVDAGGDAFALTVNVADEESVVDAVDTIVKRYGRLDVLINNAVLKPGFVPPEHRALTEMPLQTWQRVLDVNLTGAFLCARTCAKVMLKAGRGSIINVSTLSAVKPREGEPAYVVSKAGMNLLTKVLAMEVGPKRIAVNSMAVGYTITEAEDLARLGDQQRARAMRPEAWLPLALHLAQQSPDASGEVFDAMDWNVANGHGGPETWSWTAVK